MNNVEQDNQSIEKGVTFPQTILAFMQNPWFPRDTPERTIIAYRDRADVHKRLLLGTMSGRRLKDALGKLFNQIIWDNSNWRPDWMQETEKGPDHAYMQARIDEVQPTLILTFGTMSRDAMLALTYDCDVLHCHHPNARFKTQIDLNNFGIRVVEHLRARS